jgi:hypothetical protein
VGRSAACDRRRHLDGDKHAWQHAEAGALVVFRANLGEQQRARALPGHRVFQHQVNECARMAAAAQWLGRENRADSQHRHRSASDHGLQVIALGAGEQSVAVKKDHPVEVFPAPFGGHLGPIPSAVGPSAKSFSPNGIGTVEDGVELDRIGL